MLMFMLRRRQRCGVRVLCPRPQRTRSTARAGYSRDKDNRPREEGLVTRLIRRLRARYFALKQRNHTYVAFQNRSRKGGALGERNCVRKAKRRIRCERADNQKQLPWMGDLCRVTRQAKALAVSFCGLEKWKYDTA
jgi:hypothetical protein